MIVFDFTVAGSVICELRCYIIFILTNSLITDDIYTDIVAVMYRVSRNHKVLYISVKDQRLTVSENQIIQRTICNVDI